MVTIGRKIGLAAGTVTLAMQQTAAWGQSVDITYAPVNATSVPTLSEWALLGLALLLAAAAAHMLRNKTGGKPLASVLLAFALTLGTLSGHQLIGEANAVVFTPCVNPSGNPADPNVVCSLSSASGGVIHVVNAGSNVPVTNVTGVPQQVVSVLATSYFAVGTPTLAPGEVQCVAGLVVAPSGICYVYAINNG